MKKEKPSTQTEVAGHVTCNKCGDTVPKELDQQSMCSSCRLAQQEIESCLGCMNALLWTRHRQKTLSGEILIELAFAGSKFVSFHEVPLK